MKSLYVYFDKHVKFDMKYLSPMISHWHLLTYYLINDQMIKCIYVIYERHLITSFQIKLNEIDTSSSENLFVESNIQWCNSIDVG